MASRTLVLQHRGGVGRAEEATGTKQGSETCAARDSVWGGEGAWACLPSVAAGGVPAWGHSSQQHMGHVGGFERRLSDLNYSQRGPGLKGRMTW